MTKHKPPRWIDLDDDAYYTPAQICAVASASGIPTESHDVLARRLNSAALLYATNAQAAAANSDQSGGDEVRRQYVAKTLALIFKALTNRKATANPSKQKHKKPVVGPFVRFVQKAMEPLGQDITGNAIRDLLRGKQPSAKKRRKKKKSTQGESGK